MFYKLLENLNKLDTVTYILIKKGLKFSLGISVIATILLLLYLYFIQNIFIYYAGLSILKSSLFFSVFFIICGISMDTIKKQVY